MAESVPAKLFSYFVRNSVLLALRELIRVPVGVMRSVDNEGMRELCASCTRPKKTCICHLVQRTKNKTRVVVLQHPSEVKRAKGSAQLLSMSLENVDVFIGEIFNPVDLKLHLSTTALLYPKNHEPENVTAQETNIENVESLIAVDGTWRKSRKILYLNPWLTQLPRVSISEQISLYRIRKREAVNQLSTFESVVHALDIAQSSRENLLKSFVLFNTQFLSFTQKPKR